MKTIKTFTILVSALGLMVCAIKVSKAAQMEATFTYQGRLIDSNDPADGKYNFQFKLFNDSLTGSLIAGPLNEPNIDVINGYFTVELDFGSGVFDGNEVWMETTVAHGDGSDPCTLSPRQKITSTPYALQTRGIFVDDDRSIDYPTTWTAKESNRQWRAIVMSADGTKQTVVVYNGQIYVSTDSGNTWTAKESNRLWSSVAMSADGTKQTAVGATQIHVSTDSGNTWTAKESFRDWWSVAMSVDGIKQTAVAYNGQIYVSLDSGNTWTPKESNRPWTSVAMSADGTKQTAVVFGGQIYLSTDSGNNWTPKESNRNWRSVAMSADGTKQTAVVFSRQIHISTDSGNTWKAKESDRNWNSVAMSADGTIQTAVAQVGQIHVSIDSGNTWTAKESNRSWRSVAMSADGTKQTAVVYDGLIYVCSQLVTFDYKVGIGTTNPLSKLSVGGDGLADTGVYGESTGSSGYGVRGVASGLSGTTYGVYGSTSSSIDKSSGVYGEGRFKGVEGLATNTVLVTYGVRGESLSSVGRGLYGYAMGSNGVGVEGVGQQFDFFADGPGTNYGSSSSIRWKRDIRNIDDSLGKVLQLRGVYFNWDPEHGGQHDVGMIAEEVGEVLPEIVEYEENGIDATGMDYGMLAPLLVEAVKALKTEKDAEITELKGQISKIDLLRKENAQLRHRLAALEAIIAHPAGR